MRTLVHLSDLHFGRVDQKVLAPIIESINGLEPDVVVVSGDLTQRARAREFKAARAFLDKLPSPQIIVPGNHDVPMHNPLARFFQPLDKYRKYITDDLEPFHSDDELAILGLNTARSLTIKYGRLNNGQIERIRERLCPFNDSFAKIVVTHHPFDVPEGHGERDIVEGAKRAMEVLAACGADIVLAGHLHITHTGHSAKRYKIAGHSALVVQAGTATSVRGRGEVNSFNVIRVAGPEISVEQVGWQPETGVFGPLSLENFISSPQGWIRLPEVH